MFTITVDNMVVVIAADNPVDALIQFNKDWYRLDGAKKIDIRRVSGTSLAGGMSWSPGEAGHPRVKAS